jgi:hypothetical protein
MGGGWRGCIGVLAAAAPPPNPYSELVYSSLNRKKKPKSPTNRPYWYT